MNAGKLEGMDELPLANQRAAGFHLHRREEVVAQGAVAADRIAERVDVAAVVAAEAARRVEVANVVWVGAPVHPHRGEAGVGVDLLNPLDRRLDLVLARRFQPRVGGAVKVGEAGGDGRTRRGSVGIVRPQGGHRLALHKGQRGVDPAAPQVEVESGRRRRKSVGRAVVAVHAVEAPPRAPGRRLAGRLAIGAVDPHLAVGPRPLHPRDRLQRGIGGHVLHGSGEEHVHVDPLHPAGHLVAATGLHQHLHRAPAVRLVLREVEPLAQLRAVELARPVALLARLRGRPQMLDRRRDRPRIGTGHHRHHLPHAGDLRLDEPARPLADVALGAAHPGMGGERVGGRLRLHHLVARLGAEGDRVGEPVAVVAGHRHPHPQQGDKATEIGGAAALARVVQVEARKAVEARGRIEQPDPPPPCRPPHRRHQQAKDDQPRDDQVANEVEIRIRGRRDQAEQAKGEKEQQPNQDDRQPRRRNHAAPPRRRPAHGLAPPSPASLPAIAVVAHPRLRPSATSLPNLGARGEMGAADTPPNDHHPAIGAGHRGLGSELQS